MAKLNKYENTFGYDESQLVEVQYIRHERRRLKGEVTGLNWEHWRFGEKGMMHVADAAMFVSDGWVLPMNSNEFAEKLHAYQHPSSLQPANAPGRPPELSDLKWIGKVTAENLREEGIVRFEDVARLTPQQLIAHAGERVNLTVPRAEEAIMEARKLVGWPEDEQPTEEANEEEAPEHGG